jgi:hydroxyacylglutathione hydrolase
MSVVLERGGATVHQFVATELGNSSYLISDAATGSAAVIDPLRDVDRYLALSTSKRWEITAALDTHVHNDFLSGAPDLREAGARALAPVTSGIIGAESVADGDEIAIGSLRLRAIASPGHTPEHLSYLLLAPDGSALALFSGGALMVGTIARPDLLGPSHTFALSWSARNTLERLLRLDDDLAVLPTHGGGSFCGAATSDERTTSIGKERATNPLAHAPDQAHFLALHAKQGEYPTYYEQMAPRNRRGEAGGGIRPPVLTTLAPDDVSAALATGAVALDVRGAEAFDAGHIPESLCVGLDGPFSAWVGWVLNLDTEVILVTSNADDAEEAARQLRRIGFDRVGGWLPLTQWVSEDRPLTAVRRWTMADLAEQMLGGQRITVVDTRQEREWAAGHLPGAIHAMPGHMPQLAASLDREARAAVHCASGYRSAVAVSLLLREGVDDICHVSDSVEAWEELGHPLVTPT